MNDKRCKTCYFWSKGEDNGDEGGMCHNVTSHEDSEWFGGAPALPPGGAMIVAREKPASLQTSPDFGCINHKPRGE